LEGIDKKVCWKEDDSTIVGEYRLPSVHLTVIATKDSSDGDDDGIIELFSISSSVCFLVFSPWAVVVINKTLLQCGQAVDVLVI
jgi:hypothetical protein